MDIECMSPLRGAANENLELLIPYRIVQVCSQMEVDQDRIAVGVSKDRDGSSQEVIISIKRLENQVKLNFRGLKGSIVQCLQDHYSCEVDSIETVDWQEDDDFGDFATPQMSAHASKIFSDPDETDVGLDVSTPDVDTHSEKEKNDSDDGELSVSRATPSGRRSTRKRQAAKRDDFDYQSVRTRKKRLEIEDRKDMIESELAEGGGDHCPKSNGETKKALKLQKKTIKPYSVNDDMASQTSTVRKKKLKLKGVEIEETEDALLENGEGGSVGNATEGERRCLVSQPDSTEKSDGQLSDQAKGVILAKDMKDLSMQRATRARSRQGKEEEFAESTICLPIGQGETDSRRQTIVDVSSERVTRRRSGRRKKNIDIADNKTNSGNKYEGLIDKIDKTNMPRSLHTMAPSGERENVCAFCGKTIAHAGKHMPSFRRHISSVHNLPWTRYEAMFSLDAEAAEDEFRELKEITLKHQREKLDLRKEVLKTCTKNRPKFTSTCPRCSPSAESFTFVKLSEHIMQKHPQHSKVMLAKITDERRKFSNEVRGQNAHIMMGNEDGPADDQSEKEEHEPADDVEDKNRSKDGAALYHCRVCSKTYAKPASLQMHLLRAHGLRWSRYKAMMLVKNANERNAALEEIRLADKIRMVGPKKIEGKEYFLCSFCQRCYIEFRFLVVHMRAKHADQAGLEDVIKDSEAYLAEAARGELKNSGLEVPCPFCQSVRLYRAMTFHLKVCHLNEPTVEDEIKKLKENYRQFKGSKDYSRAMYQREMSRPKMLLCRYCGTSFKYRGSLFKHEKHTCQMNANRIRLYGCTACTFTCTDRGELDQHAKMHEGKLCSMCDLCGRGYKTRSGLVIHRRTIHRIGDRVPIDQHPCPDCGKTFTYKNRMLRHAKTHLKSSTTRAKKNPSGTRQQCRLCGQRFRNVQTAARHHDKAHKTDQQYTCDVCAEAFIAAEPLVRHYERHHQATHLYYCTECGVTVTQLSNLETHVCGRMVKLEPGTVQAEDITVTTTARVSPPGLDKAAAATAASAAAAGEATFQVISGAMEISGEMQPIMANGTHELQVIPVAGSGGVVEVLAEAGTTVLPVMTQHAGGGDDVSGLQVISESGGACESDDARVIAEIDGIQVLAGPDDATGMHVIASTEPVGAELQISQVQSATMEEAQAVEHLAMIYVIESQ